MKEYINPKWWTREYDSSWDRVKMAMKRDWDQTKHDMGGNEPDTNQNVSNTTRQASGREPIPPRGQPTYEELEPAHRFGYGAHAHFREEYDVWDDELETRLKTDWQTTNSSRKWEEDREAVRYGWDYEDERVAKK